MKKLTLTILILFTLTLLFSCGAKEFTVTFDSDGGTKVETQIVENGKKATKPQDPTKDGYDFLGWYLGDEEWSFIGYAVTDNITLKAKWEKNKSYTVNFYLDTEDGVTPYKTLNVREGKKIGTLPIPENTPYPFLGWYTLSDVNFENQLTEDYVVTSDMTFVAKFLQKEFTVYFDAKGGTVSEESRKVKEGEMIGILPTPERVGYKFAGWYDEEDINYDKKISQRDTAINDMVLVAKWEKDENAVIVEFIAPNSTLDEKYSYRYLQKGDRIGTLPIPTKKDFVLDYWKNDLTGEKITANTIINTNITCVAVWKKAVLCVNGTTNHDWGNWSNDYMKRERACYECGAYESISLENITSTAMGDSYPTIEGDVWGAENAKKLVNGVIESTASGLVSCKGSSPVTITLELTSPTELNMIYVSGMGSSAYSVYVTLENGDVNYLGIGEFGQICGFDVENNTVTKVVITMDNPSPQGTDIWQEIILAR